MPRKRRWTEGQFVRAVRDNTSIAGVLNDLGLSPTGSNYQTVTKYVEEFKLPTDHWTGQGHLKGKTHSWAKKRPLVTILIADSDRRNWPLLSERLIEDGILPNRCARCGVGPRWHGAKLTLRLDNINGCRTDNRKRNLRLLCPNCASQRKERRW